MVGVYEINIESTPFGWLAISGEELENEVDFSMYKHKLNNEIVKKEIIKSDGKKIEMLQRVSCKAKKADVVEVNYVENQPINQPTMLTTPENRPQQLENTKSMIKLLNSIPLSEQEELLTQLRKQFSNVKF
jgi:hypothetical protein